MTYQELVCEIAAEFLVCPTKGQADYILWERTGFPGFYSPEEGETNLDCLKRQIRAAFKPVSRHRRLLHRLDPERSLETLSDDEFLARLTPDDGCVFRVESVFTVESDY
jgi:hypothetical protein